MKRWTLAIAIALSSVAATANAQMGCVPLYGGYATYYNGAYRSHRLPFVAHPTAFAYGATVTQGNNSAYNPRPEEPLLIINPYFKK